MAFGLLNVAAGLGRGLEEAGKSGFVLGKDMLAEEAKAARDETLARLQSTLQTEAAGKQEETKLRLLSEQAGKERKTQAADIEAARKPITEGIINRNAAALYGADNDPTLTSADRPPEELAALAPTDDQRRKIEEDAAYRSGHLAPKDYFTTTGRDQGRDTQLMLGQMNIDSKQLIAAASNDTKQLIAAMAKSSANGIDKVLLHQTVGQIHTNIKDNNDTIKQLRIEMAKDPTPLSMSPEKKDSMATINDLNAKNEVLQQSIFQFLRASGVTNIPDAVGAEKPKAQKAPASKADYSARVSSAARPQTQAEFSKLTPGTDYIDPEDGKLYTK